VYCSTCKAVMPRDAGLKCKKCGKTLPWNGTVESRRDL
jgi:tRNA(Ile2) C34 agmatinyltransferase TiaS